MTKVKAVAEKLERLVQERKRAAKAPKFAIAVERAAEAPAPQAPILPAEETKKPDAMPASLRGKTADDIALLEADGGLNAEEAAWWRRRAWKYWDSRRDAIPREAGWWMR